MGWFSRDREFEEYERRERALEQSKPHEYLAYFIGINSKAIVTELRIIRWVLIGILIMLITFANSLLPAGWWHQGAL
ncbi:MULTISPECIES: hypothetical protein [Rhizobium]|jgi:hypothetical protein|uniref:hypothetical protein n=1 Tax=Rhizobium TaxID=379 RepID=UPI001030E792|nr:hypothetical protein [Rhizobium leguminosarum]NEI66903.1 hypothetical protein [Rhizobium leguminosarum]TAY35886.1 hypothetical protein ELH89_01360 [Rhizobium leguminosarum]